jgi:hypothetical protein
MNAKHIRENFQKSVALFVAAILMVLTFVVPMYICSIIKSVFQL